MRGHPFFMLCDYLYFRDTEGKFPYCCHGQQLYDLCGGITSSQQRRPIQERQPWATSGCFPPITGLPLPPSETAGFIPGNYSATLSLASVPNTMDNFVYECVVTPSSCSAITSSSGTLRVNSLTAATVNSPTICAAGQYNLNGNADQYRNGYPFLPVAAFHQ